MKHSVIYTKPVESYDPKTGKKHVIPAGKEDIVDDKELAGLRHAVRVLAPKKPKTPASE